jgi:ATP-binding cassette subfamily B protein RaxB
VILVTPFYTQLAIDTVLPGSDIDLLNIIVFGFSAILLLNALVTWLRSRLVLSLNSNLSLQTAANLFRHTIYLPTAWFEKRHLGDITTRFASLQPISDLLSRGLVSAVVDGALAITTLALMVMYSGTLAALTCSVVGIYAVLKAASFSSMKFANANVLTAQAAETSAFIENVRGVSAIKVFCQEASRQRIWQNKKTEVVNGTLKLGRLTSAFDATNGFVVGVENLIFIYVAIKMIINGELTLGMVFAFQAYKQNFVGCITRVIDQTINYRMLDVHLDRISDLALEEPERSDHIEGAMPWQSIELDNVSFSYGLDQPPVLKKVSMNLKAGKTTAIVGPSGSGKTTLFKILCGLLQPTSGRVLVDGRPIQEIGIRRYRAQLGVVSQEDVLFAGSVADNIAFFDPDYDIEQVRRCCVLAGIDDDIARMPMKYDTMVGDMGSSLSGGQRQRVLLARAIYKKPSFLMLDEGTAHLDIATEAHILHAIKQLHGGRLFVAHRPETIKSAEVIYELADGVLRLRDTDRFVVAPPPCKREIIVLRKPSPGSVIP